MTSPDGRSSKIVPDQAGPVRAQPPTRIGGQSVPLGAITVDGDPSSDWFAAAIPLIVDPPGDQVPSGLHTVSLRVTHDGENVYFLYEFAGPPADFSHLHLDVDTDATTGCSAGRVEFEFGVTFRPSDIQSSYIGDATDCTWGAADFPSALIAAVGGNFIEASVSIVTLTTLNPTLSEFDIACTNDSCDMAGFTLGGIFLQTGDLTRQTYPRALRRSLALPQALDGLLRLPDRWMLT